MNSTFYIYSKRLVCKPRKLGKIYLKWISKHSITEIMWIDRIWSVTKMDIQLWRTVSVNEISWNLVVKWIIMREIRPDISNLTQFLLPIFSPPIFFSPSDWFSLFARIPCFCWIRFHIFYRVAKWFLQCLSQSLRYILLSNEHAWQSNTSEKDVFSGLRCK